MVKVSVGEREMGRAKLSVGVSFPSKMGRSPPEEFFDALEILPLDTSEHKAMLAECQHPTPKYSEDSN